MKIKKHLVFLTPGFPKDERDTTCIPALQIFVKEFLKRNSDTIQLSIIAFQYPFIQESYQWNGATVYPIGGQNARKFLKPLIWRKVYKRLKSLHQENHIFHIHSFWVNETALVGKFFSKKNNIKHTATFMGQDALASNRYMKFVKMRNEKLVYLSHNQWKSLDSNFNIQPSHCIPFGVDKDSVPLLEKTIDIVGVGYLYEVKNFDLFIDIIDVLIKVFPSIRVEIIGDGSQRKQLEDKVINLGLQETIFFAGELPYDEALCKISSAKILLHTSISEGFGLVFAEALATGTKIVSFDVGIAKESTTWKVCRDKDEMIKALTYFIQHEKELAPSYSDLYLIEETLQGYANLFFED